VSPVKYELGFYIPEDDILHSDRRENLRYYKVRDVYRNSTVISSVIISCGQVNELGILEKRLNIVTRLATNRVHAVRLVPGLDARCG
jgi:hypothetical protein